MSSTTEATPSIRRASLFPWLLAVGLGIVVGVLAHFSDQLFPGSRFHINVPTSFVVAAIAGFVGRDVLQAVLAPVVVVVLATVVDTALTLANGTPLGSLFGYDIDPMWQITTIGVWAGVGGLGFAVQTGGRVLAAVAAGLLIAVPLASIIITLIVTSWTPSRTIGMDALAKEIAWVVVVIALYFLRRKPKAWLIFAGSVIGATLILGAMMYVLPIW
jgi:hypothetical protein